MKSMSQRRLGGKRGSAFAAIGLRLSAATMAAVGFALPAVAQKPARLPDEGGGALPWLVAGGIVVIICLSAFLNPKRSHLS